MGSGNVETAIDTDQAGEAAPKLSLVAYQRFKEKLFAQQIATGSTITQADLINLLNVPIGPLREALQVLQSEGLVTMLPRAGIRVVKPDIGLIRNSYQLRQMLEAEAVRKFAERASDQAIARWESLHRELAAEAPGMPGEALAPRAKTLDDRFHADMVAALRNPLIADVYEKTKDRILLIRLDADYRLSAIAVMQTIQEHLRIIEALRARDVAASLAAMDDHMARSLHRAIGL